MSNLIYKGKSLKGFITKAKEILFDNSASGLSATDVQDAISEIDGKMKLVKATMSSLNDALDIPYPGGFNYNNCEVITRFELAPNVKLPSYYSGTLYYDQIGYDNRITIVARHSDAVGKTVWLTFIKF